MRLPSDFFNRNTVTVARQLLGKFLVRKHGSGTTAVMITETEAYHGAADKACHASKGMTPRTRVMFGPPGQTYVYLIYGMYHCLNITTMREGFPAAVLMRGAVGQKYPDVPMDGPGKLCRALGITREQNDLPPDNDELWVEDRGILAVRNRIDVATRVGVQYAGEYWAHKPWRFIYKHEGS